MQKFLHFWGILLFTSISLHAQQPFEINTAAGPDLNPESIVEDLCFGPGIEVIDVGFAGVDESVGVFYGAQNFVGIDSGFLMTTGLSVSTLGGLQTGADRPSNFVASVNNSSAAFYPGLNNLANSNIIEDVAVYTITFVPTQDSILFRYVFASEEYPNFVCSPFNDVFGFFLTGPALNGNIQTTNLATIPGGTLPVSINSVNAGSEGNHFSVLPEFCEGDLGSLENDDFFVSTSGFPVYNGYTTVFEARALVQPCQVYTMELVIADIGDALFDSAIFFEANSFCSFGNDALISSNINEDSPILMEGCVQEPLVFDLSNIGADAYPIAYRVEGDAHAGEDYEGGVIAGFINEPTENFEIPIQTIDDGITEGAELVRVVFQSTDCFADTTELYIIDGLSLLGPTFVNCSSDGIALSLGYPNLGLNPPTDEEIQEWIDNLNYVWSTGETTPTITISPTQTTTYTVTYGNALNACSDELTVTVGSATSTIEEDICFNEPGIVVNGTLYNLENLSGTEILQGAATGGCDSIVQIDLTPSAQGILQAQLCDNESIVINGTTYDRSNDEGYEILAGAAVNGCDSIVEVSIDFYPLQTSYFANEITEGVAYQFGGQNFTATGIYEVAFTDQNGCDSIVTLDLLVEMITTTIRDSIILNDPLEYCFDTSIFQEVVSVENICEQQGGNETSFSFDEDSYCLTYTGLTVGVDSACYVLCDAFGVCDTTNFIISTFYNLLDAVDDYDSTVFDQSISVNVLANDWISSTILTDVYIVDQASLGTAILNADYTITYDPNLTACEENDQFSYAICNEIGCDTATVFLFLESIEDVCDAVWPGDVVPDGEVNQADFWAVGLGFNQGPGPIRPNASLEWFAQTAINWSTSITFIELFNAKHADTNGDGHLNNGDYEAIELNFGLEHGFSTNQYNFPQRAIPQQLSEAKSEGANWYSVDLSLGKTNQAIDDFYGLYFQVDFDQYVIDPNSIYMDWEGGWTGNLGDELDDLQKYIPSDAKLHIVSVRNNQMPIAGGGKVGQLYFRLLDANATQLELNFTEVSMVNHEGQIFNLSDMNIHQPILVSDTDLEILESEVVLFPNPAKDILNVGLPQDLGQYKVKVYNLTAKVLIEKNGTDQQIRLSTNHLPSGIYLLSIQTEKGTMNKKFSIQ